LEGQLKKKRPIGLIAIVLYKSFVAALLTVAAIAVVLTLKNYESLQDFAESYQLEGKIDLINWLLDKALNLDPQKLKLGGIGMGVYAAVTAIEAVGLWHEKRWAHVLVLLLVGISIPPEIYELSKGISLLKFVVFFINITVFSYLLYTFPKHPDKKEIGI
jgi:uncharacterized membrane protein (DUF2068 family)